VEKHVDIPRKVGGQYVFLEHVPVGVCRKCGTRYYAANVLKMIEEAVRRRRKTAREVIMPVYSLETAKTV
jgi:YgiT-type zinc finger domain-containing protein